MKKLLKKYLDHLDDKRLKEFQWYLVQIQIEGSRPIPRSKLPVNATREETVDKLVDVFGEDGAVEWTVDTFQRMNLNDLASKLVQAKVDQSMEQKEDEPGTSSATEKPREVDPTVPKDLSCSICLSLFTEPVVLQCGHSFCRSCVHEDWEKNIVRECSLCKQVVPDGDPPINFSLKSLCENYGGRSQGEPSGGHRNDTGSPQTPPNNIREKQEALKHVKQWRDSSIERIKTQCCNIEEEIMDDIKRRRALLDDEEKTRRAALRKETRQKIRMTNLIADMTKNTCLLSDAIEEIGKSGANKSFIEVFKPEMERLQTTMRNLQTISQAHLNVSRHVENLQLRDLNRMRNNRKRTSVFADPKTASSPLSASDHQTEVKFNDPWQLFPGNPEHSISYQQNLQENLKRRRAEHDYEISLSSIDLSIPGLTITPNFNFSSYDCFPLLEEYSVDIMNIPRVGVSDQVEVEDKDEDEQGRAETFREEDAQS